MYFTPQHATAIVEQLARALAPGGFLFLGHAETLRGLSHAFHLRHTHNTFYYQRKDASEAGAGPAQTTPGSTETPTAAALPDDWATTWLETVERSSNRIRALSSPATPQQAPPASDGPGAGGDLRQPLELLRSERFAEALSVLQQLSPLEAVDPAALLLRAALLTHQGELGQAEAACHELLRLDELSASAHYLLALCLERRGETAGAIEHAQTAVYLDADFAMPHLHLGLMARRRRETALARRELSQALVLFEREEASRLLLFGGGFSRNALIALCRAELSNLKGDP
jgi:chemotaxis protein methyltransferase CheR